MNVALSRARHCTLLIANFGFLLSKLPRGAYARWILGHFKQHGHHLEVSDCFPFKPEEIMAGHQSATSATTIQFGQGEDGLRVFTAGTFFPAFEGDCRAARHEITVFSPFMTSRGTARWVELWRAQIANGVRLRLVVRPPGDQGSVLEHGLAELIDSLRRIGVVVDERARMHEKIAFIDGKILWHGSLNILSHRDTTESMLRVESPGACQQVGSFVAGRKRSRGEDCSVSRAENPPCENCGKVMIWNTGRFGVWFECECGQKADMNGKPTRARQRQQDAADATASPKSQTTAATSSTPAAATSSCPQCGAPLQQKTGRFGPFIGCSAYPRCKYIQKNRTQKS